MVLIYSNLSFSSCPQKKQEEIAQSKANFKLFFGKEFTGYCPKVKAFVGHCLFGAERISNACEKIQEKNSKEIVLNIEGFISGCPLVEGGLVLSKTDQRISTVIEKIKAERPDLRKKYFFKLYKDQDGVELEKHKRLSDYDIKNKGSIVVRVEKPVYSFAKKYILNIELSQRARDFNMGPYDPAELLEYKNLLFEILEYDKFGLDSGTYLSQEDALQSEKSNRAAGYYDFIRLLSLTLACNKDQLNPLAQEFLQRNPELLDLRKKISPKQREKHHDILEHGLLEEWDFFKPNGERSF